MADPIRAQFLTALQIFNGLAPVAGPRTLRFNIDLSVANPLTIDFVTAVLEDRIEYIQSVFIDNSANGSAFKLTTHNSQQIIICPAFSQGVFSLYCPNTPKFKFESTSNGIIPIFFSNVAQPTCVWTTSGDNEQYLYKRLIASGIIKTGSGQLGGFLVASGTATVALYDGTDNTGTLILNTMQTAAGTPYPVPVGFNVGAFAQITGTGDITFYYN